MKIGILTFVEADNYGAVLQAYALQKYIKSMGHECRIIRYRNRNIWIQYHNRKLSESNSIFQYIKSHIRISLNHKRMSNFEKFRTSMELTKMCDTVSLPEMCREFDKIIVGSDQVWNPRNTTGDRAFLLDFLNDDSKKIAYAASFGNTELFDEFGEAAIKMIEKFSDVSVRERDGLNFLKMHNIACRLVADPVLLLSKEKWEQICSDKHNDEKYIFVYQLRPVKALANYVERLSKKTGLKVYLLPFLPSAKALYSFRSNIVDVYNIGPNDFLSYIKNAEYVVTDSFHGMALSICMHRNFFVYIDQSKANTSGRIHSLLDYCGIVSRYVNEDSEICLTDINYNEVEMNLDRLREESYDFLYKAFIGSFEL